MSGDEAEILKAGHQQFRDALAEFIHGWGEASRLILELIGLCPTDADPAAMAEWREGVARSVAARQSAEDELVRAMLTASDQHGVEDPPHAGFDAFAYKAAGVWVVLAPSPEPGGRRHVFMIPDDGTHRS